MTLSTLEFIAVSAASTIDLSNKDTLIVAHDARMHEVYMASYSVSSEMNKFGLLHPIKLFSPDQLNNQLENQVFSKDGRVFHCGNAWKVYEKEIFQSGQESDGLLEIETPNAETAILYVEKNLQQFPKVDWKNLNAEYIRNDIAKKSQKTLI